MGNNIFIRGKETKYTLSFSVYGHFYTKMIRDESFKKDKKSVLKEYKEIIKRAKDIAPSNNPLIGSYALGAIFIAMNRKHDNNPDNNLKLLENGFRYTPWVRRFLGSGNGYFDEKRMVARREWSRRTKERKYENDWVVDIIEKNGKYEMGYDYLECGVCKLCKDEGCFNLAKYLCKLDYLLVDVIGIGLDRTTTLAEGGDKCDFRFYSKS